MEKENRKPNKIKVGYRDIEIKYSNPDFTADHLTDCYGIYDSRKGLIDIQKDLYGQKMVNTFVHELFHAIIDISGLNKSGAPLEEDDDEEIVVHQMANNFLSVCRDNEWLLEYIKKNIK